MSAKESRLYHALSWLWQRASAAVALLAIIGALAIGIWIGRPSADADEEPEASAAASQAVDYTCSMHPSVRLKDPNAKCPICFMDLIPVDQGSAVQITGRIETMPVGRFYPNAEVRLLGKVIQDETSIARLTAYFPGRIERLFVNYVGIPVNEDDHLAEIFSPELIGAFGELREAFLLAEQTVGMGEFVDQTLFDHLRGAREKLRLFGLTQSQIEQIEKGEFNSDELTIYAPIGGVVTHLDVREGDYLQTGDPIATVADLSRLWLDLEAYESQLSLLRWGQLVTFSVEAHPGEEFEGRISFIEPFVDERTRTAAVRVAVNNTDQRLKPGMFASAVMRTRVGTTGAIADDSLEGKWVGPMHPTVVKDAPGLCDICKMELVPAETLGVVEDPALNEMPLVIPRSSVLFTGRRSVVYVDAGEPDEPKYELRKVTLGRRAGEFYVVKQGLAEGEEVVVSGAFRVDSAMQIAAMPSMMSPSIDDQSSEDIEVPEEFLASIQPVYLAYLEAQEGLAADDLARFQAASGNLNDLLTGVSTLGLTPENLAAWRTYRKALLVDEEPASIERARARFESMSDAVIEMHQQFGNISSEPLHLAYCPMAFDFRGADWLQRGQTINNPYFGASMLQCGEIRQSFEPKSSPVEQKPESNEHDGHDHG